MLSWLALLAAATGSADAESITTTLTAPAGLSYSATPTTLSLSLVFTPHAYQFLGETSITNGYELSYYTGSGYIGSFTADVYPNSGLAPVVVSGTSNSTTVTDAVQVTYPTPGSYSSFVTGTANVYDQFTEEVFQYEYINGYYESVETGNYSYYYESSEGIYASQAPLVIVPEPSSLALCVIAGVVGVAGARARRKRPDRRKIFNNRSSVY